jgi:hypothetical protein
MSDAGELVLPGSFITDFLEWRPMGSADWQPVISDLGTLAGDRKTAAGIRLRGLVWGPLSITAVTFHPGKN